MKTFLSALKATLLLAVGVGIVLGGALALGARNPSHIVLGAALGFVWRIIYDGME